MRVGDADSFIEFEFEEALPEHLPGGTGVACSVEALCDGFRGRIETVWFSREDINQFLSQLEVFEQKRKGSASLLNMSSQSEYDPLRFEIFSVDEAGHLAVSAELLKAVHIAGSLHPLKVSVGFPVDAGHLATILIGFRKLFDYRRGHI